MSAAPCATALVTGAAAGIGRAVVNDLVERGVRVAALGVDASGPRPRLRDTSYAPLRPFIRNQHR